MANGLGRCSSLWKSGARARRNERVDPQDGPHGVNISNQHYTDSVRTWLHGMIDTEKGRGECRANTHDSTGISPIGMWWPSPSLMRQNSVSGGTMIEVIFTA